VSSKPELELLIEIAKLFKKYGPETFESLAANFSSPEFSERLVTILSTTAKIARTAQPKGTEQAERKRPPRDFRSSLVALENAEPEKSALLVRFYDDLMAKTVLPTLRDIQAFVSDAGLPSVKATARDKAITPFLKTLVPMPLDELRTRLSDIRSVSIRDDRSLEGWSNIILDKERRTKESN